MNSETRNCQNCKKDFVIEPEDFDFYKKIDVPPPTFCPECRLQRRMAWRNERTFHKGKCAATGKDFLTMFSPESGMTIYDRDFWWSDAWDQLDSGQDYDFDRPFFEQFSELLKKAPLPNLANSNCVNSDYGNHNLNCKNCYLVHASLENENVSYATGAVETKDSLDLYKVLRNVECYENVLCGSLNRVFFSYDSDDSLQSEFLFVCVNMQESLGCVNMRNKSHCILNQQYSKEDFKKERAKYDFGSYSQLEKFKKEFADFVMNYPRRYATVLKSVNVTGDAIMKSKNSKHCFDIYGELEDCKYIYHGATMKDSYDGYGMGAVAELMYEAVDTGAQAMNCMFNIFTHGCQRATYTYACHSSSDIFGCAGLRSKQYCILNKQYTKEEYEEILPKIIEHMKSMPYKDSKGRAYKYGEFFPIELSPFAYNETIAQEYLPITKDECMNRGYRWRELEKRDRIATVAASDLPDHIKDVSDSILDEVIGCLHDGKCNQQCTSAFKLIPSELEFHKHFGLALPRLCPNCRHYERLKQRNPFKLWKRSCQCAGKHSKNGIYKNTGLSHEPHSDDQVCPNEFETPYAPDRKEIVYCEQCYQSEVV